MESMQPLVVIIILNYGRPDDTIECVKSLKQITYNNYQIIIIDNCSRDNSYEVLKNEFRDIPVHKTEKNEGYTGGINFGFKLAQSYKPLYSLVLNNDTLVEPDFLSEMVSAAESHTDSAAIGGLILAEHDRKTIWYAGGRLNHWRGLALHNYKGAEVGSIPLQNIQNVNFITGCLTLFRMSLIPPGNFLNDKYFMYGDDIEHSVRITKRGHTLLFAPKAIIYHKVLGETEDTLKLYYSTRNRLMLIKDMNKGLLRFWASVYFLAVISLKIFFWHFTDKQFSKTARVAMNDYFHGNFGQGNGVRLYFNAD